jgi:hypothetical protein
MVQIILPWSSTNCVSPVGAVVGSVAASVTVSLGETVSVGVALVGGVNVLAEQALTPSATTNNINISFIDFFIMSFQ